MEIFVMQNQSLLASSLQTAYNLRVLPDLVQSLIIGLCESVEGRIRDGFDLNKISKDAQTKGMTIFLLTNLSHTWIYL